MSTSEITTHLSSIQKIEAIYTTAKHLAENNTDTAEYPGLSLLALAGICDTNTFTDEEIENGYKSFLNALETNRRLEQEMMD